MALASSTRLGPYEILTPLGAGGMGEVYRAKDTKLCRDVAIKVLPEAFACDDTRMTRFEREAKVLASLNHPNIASIYGLEESNSTRALVMELVEGPTLAERIKRGALPLEEALPAAKQIAEGLEYAHERGIIHRDLKPSNVKLTPDGQVKILDFGLAKALEGETSGEELQNSPTLSAAATRLGVLLGTAAYMSPEQARGKRVDRRADIWAFGCVLYEMLTGQGAFSGETTSDVLACVIRAEPDWSAVPSSTPRRIRDLLRRCLQKDPRQRLRDVGDARIAIEEVLTGAPDSAAVITESDARLKPRERMAWTAAVAVLTIAAALLGIGYFSRTREPAQPIISQINPPQNTRFILAGLSGGPPVLSPDGNQLAFAARGVEGKQLLWVRSLDGATETPIAGTEGATFPFWSPDSRSLGFFANGKLSRVDVAGGAPLMVCDVPSARGGAWGTDRTILFGSLSSTIFRVPASGGAPQSVTKLRESEFSHRWPQFLPDGRHFLFFGQSRAAANSAIYVGSLDGGDPRLLLRNVSNAIYSPPGYLLFVRQETLLAQRFDANKLELLGDAVPLTRQSGADSSVRRGNFSVSQNGILIFAPGASSEARLLWFDRGGKQLEETGTANVYGFPRISPDGRKLAVPKVSGTRSSSIWIFDLDRRTSSRLTFSLGQSDDPAWSPHGQSIGFAFTSTVDKARQIYQQAANGTGNATPLVAGDTEEILPSWSSDGRYVIFNKRPNTGKSPWAVWAQPLFGDRKAFPVVQNPQFLEGDPALSPNGKWLAHSSDEPGRLEVELTPFPHGEGKWQVSTDGGTCARWRADGRELFYMALDNRVMSAEISEQGSSVVIGRVQPLFQANPVPRAPECMYDVTADGKKFVIVTLGGEQGAQPLTLVVNWPALLKKQRQP